MNKFVEIVDWKTRMDESENVILRGVRSTLERVQSAFSECKNLLIKQ
jgi:hypothetical protein